MSESAEKLDEADKTSLEASLAEARKDLESDDDARISAAHQRVETELHQLAEKLYKSEAQGAAAAGAAPGQEAEGAAPEADDVIDAEYTEEKGDS